MPRRFIGAGLVVAILGVALMIALPTLEAARLVALASSSDSNMRQITYAGLAYGCDWNEQFPTRGGQPGEELNIVARLPVIGFDTTTQWDWATYADTQGQNRLGGWGFIMRDYLKNDFRITVSTDGWFAKDDLLKPWEAGGPATLYSGRSGYLWLPHRAVATAGANGKLSVDAEKEIVRVASDIPSLFVMTDYIVWIGDGDTFRIAGNHQRTKAPNTPPAQWPRFDPEAPGAGNADDRPASSGAARVDARVKRRDFLDLEMYRYILDFTPKAHVF